MTNIVLGNIASFVNDSTAVTQYNANNALITTAFSDALSKSGEQPNTMNAVLDMNNNNILNLPAPATINSPVRLVDVINPSVALTVPPVGTSGSTVPLLNGINTWSATQTFTSPIVSSGTNSFTGLNTYGTSANLSLFTLYNVYNTTGTANITTIGNLTGIASGASANLASITGTSPIADIAWAFVDGQTVNGTENFSAWARYSEVRLYASTTNGYGFGEEVEATNLSGFVQRNDPYGPDPAKSTTGIQLGSGGGVGNGTGGTVVAYDQFGVAQLPSSAMVGINFVGNQADFITGINFAYNSIDGTNGGDSSDGLGNAIQFARNHVLNWFTNTATPPALGSVFSSFKIGSMATSGGNVPANLFYTNSGLQLQTQSGAVPVFTVTPVTSSANGFSFTSSITTNPVTFQATGTDSNITLQIEAKGTGTITFLSIPVVPTVAYASLPASPVVGMHCYVSNANSNTWGASITGAGSDPVLAWYNGTNWTVVGK